MDKVYSAFPNSIPLLPGSDHCDPVSYECHFSKGPLNLGVAIYSPVSSVLGSSTFFFLQPLLTGKVFAALGVLISSQIFLYLADHFFGLEAKPVHKSPFISPEQTVRMSLSDLQDFLSSVSSNNVQPSTDTSASSTSQNVTGLSVETPEIPLVCGLAVWSDFSDKPFSPTVFFLVPLVTFPGVRGALPLLILELLTTIFVRAVVPPQTTGSKPIMDPASNSKLPSQLFSPEEVLKLLNKFFKNSGT